MLRGALAQLGARMVRAEPPAARSAADLDGPALDEPLHDQATRLAAGLELLQAGLLVHDDIMDHDELRRGKPTLHMRAARRISEQKPDLGAADRLKAAEAQGICVGDLFFFLAWKELAQTPSEISSLVAKEHAAVTLAQMRDVEFGYDSAYPSLSDVLDMYRLKTARYTVALPLAAGTRLAISHAAGHPLGKAVPGALLSALEAFGEAMGIVFQIQDDRLGLFGDAKTLGKPVGSDVKEGKKTPYILALLPKLSAEERSSLFSFFGAPSVQPEDIHWLRSRLVAYGIDDEMRVLADAYTARALASLQGISATGGVDTSALRLLEEFIAYSASRSS